MRLTLVLLLLAVSACSQERFPPSTSPWPERGVNPGPFEPGAGGGTGSTGKVDRSVSALEGGAVPDTFRVDARPVGCGGVCGSGEYCLQHLSPFSEACHPLPAGCLSCSCLLPSSACLCAPPPGALVICPF